MRPHLPAFAVLCATSFGVACSFPDVTYNDAGGTDATVLDASDGAIEGAAGDAPGSDAPPGDGGAGDSGCVGFTKFCTAECVSAFDPNHGCGRPTCDPCPGPAHGTATCAPDGGCGESCDTPWADCDQNPTNGCEANPKGGDPNNCGSCKVACGDAQVCNLGDGGCAAGCEAGTKCGNACVDEQVDPNNCNGCGIVCTAGANATPQCDAGHCAYSCSLPFADCNGFSTDGCEANLKSDPDSCGTCNHKCKAGQNAAAACDDGGCGFGCQTGFYDCDNNVMKGGDCECAGKCNSDTCTAASDCCSGKCLTAALLPCIAGVSCTCRP